MALITFIKHTRTEYDGTCNKLLHVIFMLHCITSFPRIFSSYKTQITDYVSGLSKHKNSQYLLNGIYNS